MHDWHLTRLRYLAAILGNDPAIAEADAVIARFDRLARQRAVFAAARRLGLI